MKRRIIIVEERTFDPMFWKCLWNFILTICTGGLWLVWLAVKFFVKHM